MAEQPTMNEVRLLAEAVLSLAQDVRALMLAIREGPAPVYTLNVEQPEIPVQVDVHVPRADHPIAVTVIERERDDTPPTITVPVTVQPAPVQPAQVVVQEAPESPDAPMPTEWAIVREEEYPYKMVGLRAVR